MLIKRLLIWLALVAVAFFILNLLPQAYRFEHITLPATKQTLGKAQLHSPQMDAKHIEVDSAGDLFTVKDITSSRKTSVYFNGESVNASAVVIKSPTQLRINSTELTLTPQNKQLFIRVADNNQAYIFNNDGLVAEEKDQIGVLNTCRTSTYIPDAIIALASDFKGRNKPTSLLLGGALLCKKRLNLTGNDSATIEIIDEHFVLHSSSPEAIFVKALAEDKWRSLAQYTLASDGKFWAGRTKYQIEKVEAKEKLGEEDSVKKESTYNISAIASKPLQLESQFTAKSNEVWTPILHQLVQVTNLTNVLIFIAAICVVALLVWRTIYARKPYEIQQLQWYVFAVIGFTLIALARISWIVLPMEWSIYFLLLTMVLIINKFWHGLLAFVALIGVFNQLSLALTAGTENIIGKTTEQIVALTVFCLLILISKAFKFNLLNLLRNNFVQYILVFFFILALLYQLAAGSEAGIAGLPNPIETLKMAMAFLAASFMGPFIFYHGSLVPQQFLNVVKAGGGFLILAGIFLVSMSDFSPSIILLVMSCAIVAGLSLLFKTRENKKLKKYALILPASTVAILLSLGGYLTAKLDNITIDTYQLSGLPAVDRWKTLKLPNENYINAYQVTQAKIAQRNADILPNTKWEEGFAVPAIQDDFAITHLLARSGKLLTGIFIVSFIGLAFYFILFSFQAMHKSIVSKNTYNVRLGITQLAIFCSLMSAALLAHIFVNISSNLGYMPVMGQPLAFVSIANSHLVFFIMPTVVALGLLENQIKRIG